MNYRHAFHAGSPSDVLKHAVLTESVAALQEKPAPIFILDTHAGIGLYDLTADEAERTGEWRGGVGRLLDRPVTAAARYLALVRAQNPGGSIAHYPGSPALIAALLRPGDRLVLCEFHPDDVQSLRRWARGRAGVAVHHRDGYEALGAFLPPPEGRGLVLVDPPYEATDEFDRLAEAIVAGHRRFPAGRWLIWYPIKDRAPVWRLEESLIAAGIGNLLTAELLIRPEDGRTLAGSGVLLVNPPYGIEARLAALLPELRAALAPEHGAHALRRLAKG